MHAKLQVSLRTLLAAVTAVYASTAAFAQGPAAAAPPAGRYVDTDTTPIGILNSRQFEIPFSVDQFGARPQEVQLFVSRDQGQHWTLQDRQGASGREFQFNAPEDGTYWFATRTIDAAGNPHPPGSRIAPQLRVTVDTARPELSVKAEANAAGRVSVDYSYTDDAATVGQLYLQYMTDTNRTEWLTAPTSQPAVRDADGALRGRIEFIPRGDWRYLHVRLSAADPAGNQTVVTEQVERPRIAGTPVHLASTPQNRAPGSEPSDAPPAATAAFPPVSDGGYQMHTPRQITNPYVGVSAPPMFRGLGSPSAPAANTAASWPTGLGAQPASSPAAQLPTPLPRTPARDSIAPSRPIPPSSAMRPLDAETLPTPAGEPDDLYPANTSASPQPAWPAAPHAQPAPGRAPSGFDMNGRQAPEPAPAERQSAERESAERVPVDQAPSAIPFGGVDPSEIRQSRSRQFSLDYEVESVGSKGIGAVELWGSSDGGRTWSLWGSDPDNQSPFDIETQNSGVYGFRIVVVGGNGLTSPRPQPGDEADIYVQVDTESPQVGLTAARYGEGDEAGSLVIEYQCDDANLASRPISLAFSETPDGPWTTIATGLENTGRYAWPADPRLPRQIYLRIEAVDRAGNVGSETPETPVAVQGLAPRARIRGFQPIQ